MKFLLISLAITGLICYALYLWILHFLTKNEARYQREAHKVTWTHEDMVAIAKKFGCMNTINCCLRQWGILFCCL